MIRQLTRDQEQAERLAARADAAERKRQEQLAQDAGAAAARAMKAQLDSRVDQTRTLLTSVLQTPPRLPFACSRSTGTSSRTSAKRYSRCVPANDVRALAGSVEEKRATAGVLVTTAWVGPETKAFAARNNRLRIIEGGELKHLLAEHLDLDVRIDLGRPPRRKP
jgi:hypothetical protein